MIWYERATTPGSRGYGERHSIDRPMETVTTVGIGGAGAGGGDWYWFRDGRDDEMYQQADKPPYRVPSMDEIAALPWNGLNVVSTFSGCGGSCLGFKLAGYRVLWASEFVPEAQKTYRANHLTTHLDTSDIRAVTAQTIRSVIGDLDVDVLEGSPPCASFSTAGKQQQGWGKVRKYSDVSQRTDDLFDQYIRLVDELRPRAFVAENVAGMVKGVAKGYFKRYLAKFRTLPYNVEARLIDAQLLGVPQRRNRLIFVGVRHDVGAPRFPRPLPYRYSVRDAIPWIVRQGNNGGFGDGAMQDSDRPSPTIGASDHTGNGRFPPSLVEVRKVAQGESVADNVAPTLDGYATGTEYDKLALGETSSKFFNLIRTHPDFPCQTVTASGGSAGAGAPGGVASVAAPYDRRKFTLGELRRICGFPDDFVLTGTYAQGWERLGRAVPPPMMAAIARELTYVLAKRG